MVRRAIILSIVGSAKELAPTAVEGLTDPLIALARAEDGERIEVVVKPTTPWKPPRGDVVPGEILNVREIASALLLRAVGIPAPEPFVVTGGALPWAELSARHAARLSNAPHFATTLIRNARECAQGERLDRVATDALRLCAEDLFAADNVILNLDRTELKPNLWWRHDALIPIDHGLAFAILKARPAMLGIPTDVQKRHAVFSLLQGKAWTFDRALGNWLKTLTAETISELERSVPDGWIADREEIERIKTHLSAQPSRLDGLKRILTFWFAKPNA